MDILKQSSDTREDLGLLAVMEALEAKEQITQRELAQATGLNLKKVNYCLHKLLEKGHVKFEKVRKNPDKRAYLYILTPAGMRMKSELTYRFLRFTLDFYTRVEEKIRRTIGGMERAGLHRVVLFGATDAARILADLMEGQNSSIAGIVDASYDGKEFHGLDVYADLGAVDVPWDAVLITALEGVDEIEGELKGGGAPPDVVWRLF